jgi:hypothetical protein
LHEDGSHACASAIEIPFTVFADPSKYEWHSCEQLGPQRKYWETREQELKLLMDKAAQGTGGAAIIVGPTKAITSGLAKKSRSSTQRHAPKNAKCRTTGKVIPPFDDARRSLHLT